MRFTLGAAATAASLLFPAAAFAGTIRVVPGEGNPIQAAFDQAVDGDVILVTKGTYPAGAVLSDRAGITVKGLGKPVIDGSGSGADGLSFGSVSGLTVKGLVFRDCSEDGIRTASCSLVRISKCSFEGIGGTAIEDELSDGFSVTGCRLDGAYAGIMLSWQNPTIGTLGIVLKKNELLDIPQRAIGFAGPGAIVEGNSIVSGGLAGIVARTTGATTGASIRGNRIHGVQYGLSIGGSGHVVAKNRVTGCQVQGLQLLATSCTIERNAFLDCLGFGMRIDAPSNVIRFNTSLGSGDKDLGATTVEEQNTYEKNRYETSQFGIYEGPPI